jgi:protein phosphatase
MYYEPVRPFQPIEKASYLSAQQLHDDLPDIEDVIGKRYVETRLRGKVTVQEENAITALEVMSRFAVHPRWLIYLPPTMSPSETSTLPDLLEHPKEAFAYFRKQGLKQVICEEKHMGSRAVVVICRNAEAAQARFGATMGELGSCYTRTGRAFFTDKALERQFLERLSTALGRSGFWERFNTDWACLDTELMPWSAKAMALVKEQYAAVGAAARTALHQALPALEAAAARGIATENLLNKLSSKQHLVKEYTAAYGRYCWPVYGIEDYRLAAFHLLATEGALHTDKNHLWHMEQIYQMCEADPDFLVRTPYQVVNLEDEEQVQSVINWWVSRTEAGGEGMVIKPLDFISKGPKGLIQPALKCRGREYLRIIYGPEYTLPENLERLKARGLSTKRSLALREFALGVEALERFVKKEPLRKVHECVFAVLAMESEAVDPRL